jgi:hypothetical protein
MFWSLLLPGSGSKAGPKAILASHCVCETQSELAPNSSVPVNRVGAERSAEEAIAS